MNTAVRTGGILAVCGSLTWVILTAPGRIERWADRQAEATRASAAVELRSAVAVLDTRAAQIQAAADARAASVARRIDARLAAIQADTREAGANAARLADARIGQAVAELGRLREDLKPVLAEAHETLAQASGTIAVWRPQGLGAIAAFKVTMGDVAQMSRTANRAFPQFTAGVNQVVANSDRTTAASAGLIRNLEQATKPLPKWMRIGLGVAPPLAQTGAAAASAWALIGR